MTNEYHDPQYAGKFMMVYPTYALFNNECTGPLLYQNSSGDVGLLLFTDRAQVDKYRSEENAIGPLIEFFDAAQVVLYANELPPHVTHVVIDPAAKRDGKRAVSTVLLSHFVQVVMADIQRRLGGA